MATTSAPTQEAPVVNAAPLWPAPVFVLGVAALVAVYLCRPLRDVDTHHRARDLRAARELLAQPDGDVKRALELAERVHKSSPGRGEASFLAGTAHARLAEQEPANASQHWVSARQFFEMAESKGLTSDEERIALVYALARIDFHEGHVPQAITRLEACAEQVEPKARAEACDLLTRSYLRLSPPDLDRALLANERLRQTPDLSGPDMASAQLTGGELLLRKGKPREARKELELIKEQFATPTVLVRARLLLGRCHQDEKQYDLAVTRYLAALKDGRVSVPQPAQVYYNLGLCYRELNKPQEAAAAWKECVRLAQAEPQEANSMQAASIVLAELGLLPPNAAPESVIEHLRRAVQRVGAPEEWKNPLLDLSRARQVFEDALAAFRQAGRYDLALKALEPYVRLAPARRAVELRGQLSWEWARVRREKAPADGAGGTLDDAETLKLFSQAAAAFGQAAELPQLKPNEVAEHLWAAASCHLAAGEGKPAADKLERLVKMELDPARLGEAWYLLGEEYRNANVAKKAESAYQECLKYVTRFAYLARYQLAMAALSRGEIDAASDSLKFNLSQLTWDADAEAMSQTLFALCGLLYRQARYREVVRYYERALSQYAQRFQAAGTLMQARLQLASSYRQIASQANVQYFLQENQSAEARAHFQREHRQWLIKAAEEFGALDGLLESVAGQGAQGLTADERNQVPFVAAKCWFNLGQYDKALAVYERLIAKYEGKVEGLDALGGAVSCHAALGQVSKVQWRLLQIEKTIEAMPPEIRDPWKNWLEEAKKGLEGVKE